MLEEKDMPETLPIINKVLLLLSCGCLPEELFESIATLPEVGEERYCEKHQTFSEIKQVTQIKPGG